MNRAEQDAREPQSQRRFLCLAAVNDEISAEDDCQSQPTPCRTQPVTLLAVRLALVRDESKHLTVDVVAQAVPDVSVWHLGEYVLLGGDRADQPAGGREAGVTAPGDEAEYGRNDAEPLVHESTLVVRRGDGLGKRQPRVSATSWGSRCGCRAGRRSPPPTDGRPLHEAVVGRSNDQNLWMGLGEVT